MGSITPWPAGSEAGGGGTLEKAGQAEQRARTPWGQVLHSLVQPSRRLM